MATPTCAYRKCSKPVAKHKKKYCVNDRHIFLESQAKYRETHPNISTTRTTRKLVRPAGSMLTCRQCGNVREVDEKAVLSSGKPRGQYCSGSCQRYAHLMRQVRAGMKHRTALPPYDPHPYYNFCFFDIETTGLRSPFGEMTCAAMVWSDITIPAKVILCADRSSPLFLEARDHKALVELRDILENADGVVTWYGKGFDVKMINARLVMFGERTMAKLRHIDACTQLARQFAFYKRSLRAVTDILGIQPRKPDLLPMEWIKGIKGDTKALDVIIERCLIDAMLTREVFPYIKNALRAMMFS